MTNRNYSDPKTMEKIIKKCRELQEEFNSEINLDYLEEALAILEKAIENTSEEDPGWEKYVNERNRLYNRYPDIERWLSEPRNDYQIDVKPIVSVENENREDLDLNIFIKNLNEFNRRKKLELQEFFNKHKNIFIKQFDYAMVGFEGTLYCEIFPPKFEFYNEDSWVSIFLRKFLHYRFSYDESFKIYNAPPLVGPRTNKVYIPVRPNFFDEDPNNFPILITNNINHAYMMPIDIIVENFGYSDSGQDISRGFFEFSSQLINQISSLHTLIQKIDLNELDIKSFHFLVDYLHINNKIYEKIKNSRGSYGSSVPGKQHIKVFGKNQILSEKWPGLQRLVGDRKEKIFGHIEITFEDWQNHEIVISKNGYVNLRIVFNNHPYGESLNFEYWNDNPNSYNILSRVPLSEFIAMFSDLQEEEN
jgi:hypothetical protein